MDCPGFLVEHVGLLLLAEGVAADGDAVLWELAGGSPAGLP